jgi:carnitine 3-dehydrogenase
MHPLRVRTEIDGFIADRLLEALWREALWLVHDDVATVEEVDDAIRYGAGLRWAIMGTFLTYRIAGGQAGMRHFLEQFGPALAAPWTKLVDVPELTPSFLDKLGAQSDAQAGGLSVGELERLRDDCLVAILQGLRVQDTAAGRTLAGWEQGLLERVDGASPSTDGRAPGPLELVHREIPPEWIDYNGHVHESRYLQLFGDATDALLRRIGVDQEYVAAGHSYYTVETHLSHLQQLVAGERVRVLTQVLGHDERRLHLFHTLTRQDDDGPVAAAEQMLIHVDTAAARAAPVRAPVAARVQTLAADHAALPPPRQAGRKIALHR